MLLFFVLPLSSDFLLAWKRSEPHQFELVVCLIMLMMNIYGEILLLVLAKMEFTSIQVEDKKSFNFCVLVLEYCKQKSLT